MSYPSCVKRRNTRLSPSLFHLFNTTLLVAMTKTRLQKQPLLWGTDNLVGGGQLIRRSFPTEWPHLYSHQSHSPPLDYKAGFWETLLFWSECMCPPRIHTWKVNSQCKTFETVGLWGVSRSLGSALVIGLMPAVFLPCKTQQESTIFTQ